MKLGHLLYEQYEDSVFAALAVGLFIVGAVVFLIFRTDSPISNVMLAFAGGFWGVAWVAFNRWGLEEL